MIDMKNRILNNHVNNHIVKNKDFKVFMATTSRTQERKKGSFSCNYVLCGCLIKLYFFFVRLVLAFVPKNICAILPHEYSANVLRVQYQIRTIRILSAKIRANGPCVWYVPVRA